MAKLQEIIESLNKDRERLFNNMIQSLDENTNNTAVVQDFIIKTKIIDAQLKVLKTLRDEENEHIKNHTTDNI